jgi:hypothetical protein
LYRGGHIIVCKLQIVQPGVGSTLGEKFRVCPSLADLGVFEHQNLVGAADRRQPMSYHKSGSSNHQVRQCLLYEHFGFGIELGGGFVQN